jgi:hypothetical protein
MMQYQEMGLLAPPHCSLLGIEKKEQVEQNEIQL